MEDLLKELDNEREWLQTIEGDEVDCISTETILGILQKYNITKK